MVKYCIENSNKNNIDIIKDCFIDVCNTNEEILFKSLLITLFLSFLSFQYGGGNFDDFRLPLFILGVIWVISMYGKTLKNRGK